MAHRSCIALLLAVGCFGEPASGTSCPDGEAGCPCAASGCDAGLACAAGVDLCIPENCIPGSELCTCNEGLCLTGLACDGALCRPAEGGETAAATSDVDSSTLGTMTSDPQTSSGTSSEPTSDTSSGTTSEMPSGEACRGCISEANKPGGQCELAFDTCMPLSGCTDLAACIEDCVGANDPECIPGCCRMFPGGAEQYTPVGSCDANVCSSQCSGFAFYCPT